MAQGHAAFRGLPSQDHGYRQQPDVDPCGQWQGLEKTARPGSHLGIHELLRDYWLEASDPKVVCFRASQFSNPLS